MALSETILRESLVNSGGISSEQFEQIKATKEASQIGIDQAMLSHGLLPENALGQLVSSHLKVPFIQLSQVHVPKELLLKLPEAFARSHEIIPYKETSEAILIATSDPTDILQLTLLEKYLRKPVQFAFALSKDVRAHMYLFQTDAKTEFERILSTSAGGGEASETKIIDLVNAMITHAYQNGASDIHIEPEEVYTVVRYRKDGILHDIAELPSAIHENIMTRLKVLARLATDEHRIAQDGKIGFQTTWGDKVEIRVSLIPTTHSEKAVMRLLSDQSHAYSLASLGLSTQDFKRVSDVIQKPWGMILVSGPTGSGKTTSLYAMLRILNQRDVNVTTIEDPVEFDIEGVSQIQVNEKTGLTFAKGLRSIVRQDPDIIMVGEIRDSETADIAVNAAMTGHLVLSTLHTNDAATAFPRLQDMGVEDFLIASTVSVIIAQRLIRKICMNCIYSINFDTVEKEIIAKEPLVKKYLQQLLGKKSLTSVRTYKGKGCTVCHQTGYSGRIGVFEVLTMSEEIRKAVMERKNADEIRAMAMKQGMTTMLYDGLRKVTTGQTTLEEVMRVTRE